MSQNTLLTRKIIKQYAGLYRGKSTKSEWHAALCGANNEHTSIFATTFIGKVP